MRDYVYVRHGVRATEVGSRSGGQSWQHEVVAVQAKEMARGEGFTFNLPVGNMFGEFLSNCCRKEEPSLPRKIVRSRPWSGTDKRRKLCNGHSQKVRVPVPERSRRRGDGGTGVDAGADGHQPPRGTVFIDADTLPLSEQFASLYAAFPWNNRSRAHQRSR